MKPFVARTRTVAQNDGSLDGGITDDVDVVEKCSSRTPIPVEDEARLDDNDGKTDVGDVVTTGGGIGEIDSAVQPTRQHSTQFHGISKKSC